MIAVPYKGLLIDISDRDYYNLFIDCEGACHHCMSEGSCKLENKMKKKLKKEISSWDSILRDSILQR